MITKEDFLSGKPFHYMEGMKTRPFRFKPGNDNIGTIDYFITHEAIVVRVTKSYIDCRTTILGNLLKTRIYFKNLYL